LVKETNDVSSLVLASRDNKRPSQKRPQMKFYSCRYLKSFPPGEAPGAEHRRADHTSHFRRQIGSKNDYAFISTA